MLISLTVGKVDAGVAVLLTEDKRLIEFPSILLPPSISSGSIVDITVSRNHTSETAAQSTFRDLQSSIFQTYGTNSPSAPVLRCRNATQTSVVLEWDPIALATADLRSLSLYRNGQKVGNIPRPLEMTSTKISGLAIDQDFTFHLVLRTSAGKYTSEKLPVRTHKMTDLSGITVAPGVLAAPLRASLSTAVARIGAKISESVRIDTTHFVCTEGRGREWERAVEMNIPVVRPEWVEGCEREGRIVGVRGYYLNADPRLRQVGQGVGVSAVPQPQRSESQVAVKQVQEQSGVGRETGTPPPAPPEKDERPVRSQSRPSAAALASTRNVTQAIPSPQPSPATVEDEDEAEDEDEDEDDDKSSGSEHRVVSTTDLPHRGGGEGKAKQKGQDEDDVGSFSEVAL